MVVWCFLKRRLCERLHGLIGVPQWQSPFTFMGGSGKHTTTRRGTGKKCVEGRGWELVLLQTNDSVMVEFQRRGDVVYGLCDRGWTSWLWSRQPAHSGIPGGCQERGKQSQHDWDPGRLRNSLVASPSLMPLSALLTWPSASCFYLLFYLTELQFLLVLCVH